MSIVAILGAHWGDEGKGKIAAALSADAVACARFQGGPNAGHTVAVDGTELVLRMVPSGIVAGVHGVIGGGCVIEPRMLLDEVAGLRERYPDILQRLLVSRRAHVITPRHREQDRSGSGVGSTRMGVGPAYRDRAARSGLRVADLLAGGRVPGELRATAEEFADTLGAVCGDDTARLREILDAGGRVVAEGAQGVRLDVDHGDYPYVTSSNTTVGAVLTGLGVGPRDIGTVLLVTPAYVTKVGGGDLPSRVGPRLNAYLQERGRELDGATGLVRDTGWLDVGWLRTACRLNQADGLVVTKVDVLAGLPTVGLYGVPGAPRVTMLPGWTAGSGYPDAGHPDPGSGPLGEFLGVVEHATGCPVQAVSYGPGTADWWCRGPVFPEDRTTGCPAPDSRPAPGVPRGPAIAGRVGGGGRHSLAREVD